MKKLFNEAVGETENEVENVGAGYARDAVLLQAFWAAVFGYFAYGYSKEPTSF